MRGSRPQNPFLRFYAKIRIDIATGCHVWTAGLDQDGYARFAAGDGTTNRGARWIYQKKHGMLPRELTVDHLCRNKACVNPEHLQPVTFGENVLRGGNRAAVNARKTHCHMGHALEGDNVFRVPKGRQCRTCHRIRVRRNRARYDERQRAEKLAQQA